VPTDDLLRETEEEAEEEPAEEEVPVAVAVAVEEAVPVAVAVTEAVGVVTALVAVVVVADAVVLPAPGFGMLMDTPAEEQRDTTPADRLLWAGRGQAVCTHGTTLPTKSGFLQWQAKSVRAQPSEVRGGRRQLVAHCGI